MVKKSMAIIMALVIFLSCKKDGETFSATGYWNGSMYVFHSAILNRSDGTARFYMQIMGSDTVNPKLGKHDGTYTVKGNTYRAVFPNAYDTVIIETFDATSRSMSGIVTVYNAGAGYPCEFFRQP